MWETRDPGVSHETPGSSVSWDTMNPGASHQTMRGDTGSWHLVGHWILALPTTLPPDNGSRRFRPDLMPGAHSSCLAIKSCALDAQTKSLTRGIYSQHEHVFTATATFALLKQQTWRMNLQPRHSIPAGVEVIWYAHPHDVWSC